MSDATTLIRRALDAGIELRFVDGQLKVTGKRPAVESWAPTLRANKPALIAALQPAAEPVGDWRELARQYYGHHFGCRHCIGAGRGTGLPHCDTGSVLWAAYNRAISHG